MINHHSEKNYHKILEGIHIKTLVLGKSTLMSKFRLSKNAVIPQHSHPYEQTGYLISGNIILHIEDKKFEMKEGDSWCIHYDCPHMAEVIDDSMILEIFSPPRDDYKKFLDKDAIL
ncbi:MAG: cupin domain-containing protein [Bacteroidetes bacterium]|nr:cupin domain-containing protein [Bacteroidota bacterium]